MTTCRICQLTSWAGRYSGTLRRRHRRPQVYLKARLARLTTKLGDQGIICGRLTTRMDTRKTLTMRTWTSGAYSNRMGRHQQGVASTFTASCVLSARVVAYQAEIQVSQLASLMTQGVEQRLQESHRAVHFQNRSRSRKKKTTATGGQETRRRGLIFVTNSDWMTLIKSNCTSIG